MVRIVRYLERGCEVVKSEYSEDLFNRWLQPASTRAREDGTKEEEESRQ